MHSPSKSLLVINTGSSSDKLAVYQVSGRNTPEELASEAIAPEGLVPEELAFISIDWTKNTPAVELRSRGKNSHERLFPVTGSKEQCLQHILPLLFQAAQIEQPAAVVIRVVHGGQEFREPLRVDAVAEEKLANLAKLAPLHNFGALHRMKEIKEIFSSMPVIAVFDTAFHITMPLSRQLYAVPYEWYEQQHIQKYGFHGINHEYCARQVAVMAGLLPGQSRIVSCHLGSGASLCAVADGKSVDTTMGFTPLDGLVMGTRCGSIDPGIILTLLAEQKYPVSALSEILYKKSGLLGLSGISSDMRLLESEAIAGNTRAALAIDVFMNRLIAEMSRMIASLGGLDAIVFTGGIGENSSLVRKRAIDGLAYLGLKLDEESNSHRSGDRCISSRHSAARVFVVCAREELQMTKMALPLL